MKQKSLILFILFAFISCGEETIEVDGSVEGKDYFPVDLGREWIYQTDSIVYDESKGIIDTLSGYVREVISESLSDGTFIITRSYTKDLTEEWEITDIWSGRIEDRKAVRTEENLSFIKLVFPPNKSSQWDGNALFDENVETTVAGEPIQPYQGWDYEIVSIDGTYSQDTISVSNIVEVLQVDVVSVIDRRYSLERFAKNIGLVEKKMMILDCQCSSVPDSVPWEEKAEKGFILTQKLISYQ